MCESHQPIAAASSPGGIGDASSADARRPPEPTSYSLVARLRDVFLSPSALFDRLTNASPWLDVLLLTCFLNGGITWALWSSPVGEQLIATQREQILKVARDRLDASQVTRAMEQMDRNRQTPMQIAVQVSTGSLLGTLLGAGLCWLGFTFIFLNDSVSYTRVLSILSHAACVGTVELMLLSLLTYATGSLRLAGGLPDLFPFIPEPAQHTYLAAFAKFDLIGLWWVGVMSVGIGKAFRRPRWPSAVVLAVFPIIVAVVQVALIDTTTQGGWHQPR